MNPKLQWLRNKMSSSDLQGLIISNPVNIKYLTNIDAEGILFLTRKENIYITDGSNIEHVHSTLTLFDENIVYDIHDVSKDDYENLLNKFWQKAEDMKKYLWIKMSIKIENNKKIVLFDDMQKTYSFTYMPNKFLESRRNP